MPAAHLAFTAVLALGASACFVTVAHLLVRRRTAPAVRGANLAFAVGWFFLGIEVLTDGLRLLTGLDGVARPDLYLVLVVAKILAAGGVIAGFGHYVAFLYTGRAGWAVPAVLVGALHAVFFLVIFAARLPLNVEVGTWSTRLVLTSPGVLPPTFAVAAVVLFFLPPLLLAVAYVLLVGKLSERALKVRVVAVAVALVIFHLAAMVQSNPETSGDTPVVPVFTALILLSGILSVVSYRPPGHLARRFDLRDVRAEPSTAPGP